MMARRLASVLRGYGWYYFYFAAPVAGPLARAT
jgi:hypothetical protein